MHDQLSTSRGWAISAVGGSGCIGSEGVVLLGPFHELPTGSWEKLLHDMYDTSGTRKYLLSLYPTQGMLDDGNRQQW